MITRRGLLKSAIATAKFLSRKKKAKPWSNVSIVTLGVRDLAASRRFYADGLGWKPVFKNKEIVFFQAAG
jgi:catechol-2,3-dioxygenase